MLCRSFSPVATFPQVTIVKALVLFSLFSQSTSAISVLLHKPPHYDNFGSLSNIKPRSSESHANSILQTRDDNERQFDQLVSEGVGLWTDLQNSLAAAKRGEQPVHKNVIKLDYNPPEQGSAGWEAYLPSESEDDSMDRDGDDDDNNDDAYVYEPVSVPGRNGWWYYDEVDRYGIQDNEDGILYFINDVLGMRAGATSQKVELHDFQHRTAYLWNNIEINAAASFLCERGIMVISRLYMKVRDSNGRVYQRSPDEWHVVVFSLFNEACGRDARHPEFIIWDTIVNPQTIDIIENAVKYDPKNIQASNGRITPFTPVFVNGNEDWRNRISLSHAYFFALLRLPVFAGVTKLIKIYFAQMNIENTSVFHYGPSSETEFPRWYAVMKLKPFG